MLIRRHFRIKSLQFLYAQYLSKMNSKKVEENMLKSIEELHNLYISLLYLILKIRDRAIIKIKKNKISKNLDPTQKLAYNSVIKILSNNKHLLEYNSEKILWKKKDEYIFFIIEEIKKSKFFINFVEKSNSSFENDKIFIIKYYQSFLIPNKKLKECVEEQYTIEIYDLCIAHTMVCKTLQYIKLSTPKNFQLYNIYNNNENKKFIINLYRNTISHKKEFNSLINRISNNWNIHRISMIDLIILQMAICEFLYFPNIPPKATMNEYIEIAKMFCMEKSKIFINGILDQVFKLLYNKNKIFKIGKGLM
ncbi:transcription antitermination factor NusB [Blattabacterium cuenoti]|uniref:transcription antitermination factor NusB n=1 Tax=Blattabacterium cuenoti TaxID=1653831 RepID=UPI00163B9E92|nr:transcription antitermination factor NusB [Blattabacterium cuenoti]